jgi:hypothetical protein
VMNIGVPELIIVLAITMVLYVGYRLVRRR